MIRILTPVFLALVSVALADKDGGSNPTPTAVPSDCCPPGYTLQGSYSIYAIMPTPYLGIGYCRIWQKDAIDPTKMKLDFDDSHSEGDVDICVNSAIPAHEAKAVTTTWQWSGIPNIEYKPQPWAITARVPLPSKPGDCDLYLVTAKTVDSGLCNVVEGPKLGLEAVTICRPKAEWDCEADSEGCDNTTIYYWNRHYFKYTVGCPISLLGRTGTECINSSYSYTITDVNSDSEIFSENGMGLINHVTGVPSNLQPYHEDAGNVNHSGDIPNSPPGFDLTWPSNCSSGPSAWGFYDNYLVSANINEDNVESSSGGILHHEFTTHYFQTMYIDGDVSICGTGIQCSGLISHKIFLEWDTDNQGMITSWSYDFQ